MAAQQGWVLRGGLQGEQQCGGNAGGVLRGKERHGQESNVKHPGDGCYVRKFEVLPCPIIPLLV